jgi:hypothetical protein
MLLKSWMLIIAILATNMAHAQTGLIRGTLLNSNGSSVAKADVYAMFFLHCVVPNDAARSKIESGAEDRCLSHWDRRVDTTTDDAGVFELQGLQLGVYELAAQKPEDGYRSTFRNLFTGEPPVRVVLSTASAYAEVTLHFPPKCALLTGTVRNATTGKLLSDVEVRMYPKAEHRYENDGVPVPMHELIPAEREFTLEIAAPGFESRYYRGPFDRIPGNDAPATLLNLEAGQEFHLDIALIPKRRPVHPD